MESPNGRMGSEAPSSSSSDFYSTTEPSNQPQQQHTAIAGQPTISHDGHAHAAMDLDDDHEENDSSVEMDLSDDSRPSTSGGRPEPEAESTAMPLPLQDAQQPSSKRKLGEDDSNANESPQISAEGAKRPRLSPSTPVEGVAPSMKPLGLPVELWQRIFLHLSPTTLARCVRVCRTLKQYLTEPKADPTASKVQARSLPARRLDSETVWAQARKAFYPGLPRPLVRLTELQMLQLIGNTSCQFCGNPPSPPPPPATNAYNCGPGSHGVCVIWPFGVRSCGTCIQSNSLKVGLARRLYVDYFSNFVRDVDVLRSKAATLIKGLPFGFLTPDLHFIPETTRLTTGIPANLRAMKMFYKQDIDNIIEESGNASSFGAGAAEEWMKGLVSKGKEAMTDAARWEQWAAQLQHGTHVSQTVREYHVPSTSQSVAQAENRSVVPNGSQPAMVPNGFHPLPQPVSFAQQPYAYPTASNYSQPAHYFSNYPATSGPYYGTSQTQSQPPRPVRTTQDIENTLQARKADIERRCMELVPPLQPSTLHFIGAFQNTMKIPQPMTDQFWESTLKPLILAERQNAEVAEHTRNSNLAYLQAAVPHTRNDEPYSRPAKEVYDKEYERAQETLRQRLSEYADDFINNHWQGGELDKTNAPVFAVQIIEFVDWRYRQDELEGKLPPTDQIPRGNRDGSPIPDPFLSLHNMKWVVDNKIRPLTDKHNREPFLCAPCVEENKTSSWRAFEGLIQHYAARHTSDFSKGNIVVHWQTSDWPSELPFVRDPASYIKPKKTHHSQGNASGYGKSSAKHQQREPDHAAYDYSNYYAKAERQPRNQVSPNQAQMYAYNGYGQPPETGGQPVYEQNVSHMHYDNPETSYEAQLNKLADDMSEIWHRLDGVKEGELMNCIRVQTVIHHAYARFVSQFGRLPNLDLMTDVLATIAGLQPMKSASGLACKQCVAEQPFDPQALPYYFSRIQKVKSFTTAGLVNHFKLMHPGHGSKVLDWTTDMIEVPEASMIVDTARAPGMDDEKLELIAAAFPTAFPNPRPKVVEIAAIQPENPALKRLLDRTNKKSDPPKKRRKGQSTANGTPAREESEPLPEAREDEYDPRRPMALPFDDGTARGISAGSFTIPQETLDALAKMNTQRAPSVGREDAPSAFAPPTGSPSGQAPDIASILAQLTGGNQTTTPPTTTSRSSSQPKNTYIEPSIAQLRRESPPQYARARPSSQYAQPLQYRQSAEPVPRFETQERPTSSRYAQPMQYRPSAEPSPRHVSQDYRDAQAYNARQFDSNRVQSCGEPYAPAPEAHSPPRYRQVYEERPQFSPPSQYTPVYRAAEPQTQFVRVHSDGRDYYPQPQHQQYAQQPSYPEPSKLYDEHGREIRVVSIDAGPAPVQYLPHPYEQQQQQYLRPPTQQVNAHSPTTPQFAPRPYYETGYVAPPPQQSYGYEEQGRGSVPRR